MYARVDKKHTKPIPQESQKMKSSDMTVLMMSCKTPTRNIIRTKVSIDLQPLSTRATTPPFGCFSKNTYCVCECERVSLSEFWGGGEWIYL